MTDKSPEHRTETPAVPGLARRLWLARFAIAWERVWPAIWPALTVSAVFCIVALLDLLPRLHFALHGAALVLFAAALAAAPVAHAPRIRPARPRRSAPPARTGQRLQPSPACRPRGRHGRRQPGPRDPDALGDPSPPPARPALPTCGSGRRAPACRPAIREHCAPCWCWALPWRSVWAATGPGSISRAPLHRASMSRPHRLARSTCGSRRRPIRACRPCCRVPMPRRSPCRSAASSSRRFPAATRRRA